MDVLLIDAQRVTAWDVTALEAFRRMADEFQRTHVEFMLSHPADEARKALSETVKLFSNTDKALEWAENEVLRRAGMASALQGKPFERLHNLPLLAPLSDAARNDLPRFGKILNVTPGQAVFNVGDTDGSLLVLMAGNVSIEVAGQTEVLRVATFGPGLVFGEMAFLDGSPRSAKATAVNSCQLFLLPRANFDMWAQHHPADALKLLGALAGQISHRLRITTGQLIALNP
jgi:SulP family sulfate permease